MVASGETLEKSIVQVLKSQVIYKKEIIMSANTLNHVSAAAEVA